MSDFVQFPGFKTPPNEPPSPQRLSDYQAEDDPGDTPDDMESVDTRPLDDWCRIQGWDGVRDCPSCGGSGQYDDCTPCPDCDGGIIDL